MKIWQRQLSASAVDFHGCSKPTGLHRAYPNILSYEAMRCGMFYGIPLLIRIISFNVSLPVCWEVELIILPGSMRKQHIGEI